MSERIMLGAEEAQERLTGQKIDSVEFEIWGSDEDQDSIIIRVGDITLYADRPTVYASAVQS